MDFTNEMYLKNKNCLNTRSLNFLEELEDGTKPCFDIKVEASKDGNKCMLIEKDGQDMCVNSKFKPLEEAKRWAKSLEIRDDSVIVVFGFGLGYHAIEILEVIGENNKVVVIEPNTSIFDTAIKYIDCSKIFENSNIYFAVGQTAEQYKFLLWQFVNWVNIKSIILSAIPNYVKLFPEEYGNFVNVVKDIANTRIIDKNTIFHFSEMWQENLFKNIPYILKSNYIKNLYDAFKGKPAIVVSAGPSLNKNVHLLREIKEKAVIICVGTALKALLKENIKPDLVISIDGGIANYRHFEHIEWHDIPLVYSPRIYYDILKHHNGEKMLFLSGDNYVDKLFRSFGIEVGALKSGGSVANGAFDLAVRMGADPVVLIGQDLAYTDNRTHASGTVYEKDKPGDGREYMTVEDINGNEILTDSTLYSFLVWFQNEIEKDKTGRIYIDATEGGAKIKGTAVMSLAEVIEKYCHEDIQTTKKIADVLQKKKLLGVCALEAIVKEYRETQKEFKMLKNRCQKAVDFCSELCEIYRSNRLKGIERILKELDRIDIYIKDKKGRFELINMILQPVIYSALNGAQDKESQSEREKGMQVAEKSRVLYEGIVQALDYVEPLLYECIGELEKGMHA